MYQAKERGRNRAEIYDAGLQSKSSRQAHMDVALRFALERNELSVTYQPKVSLTDGSLAGFELLLRWNSPEYGLVSPTEFIPIAETSGLVVPIGMWAMEQACCQLAAWQQRYPARKDLTVAVNVSMRQLLQASFFSEVQRILDTSGVVPQMIELELTETSAMANPLQTIENLAMLKKLGLCLALDDFGTGYSSLAYLQKLPIDVLKIDKAFVHGLGTNRSDMEITRLIMVLAQTLELQTIAEGVETPAHIRELKKMGCDLGQGYLFSTPLSAEEAEKLIRSAHRFPLE
jgi:EAL domain-containing protein (putative c-di-GMP-specific phosphodiesterase class I)